IVRTMDAMRISLVGLEICSPSSASSVDAPASSARSTSSGCTGSRPSTGAGPSCMRSRIGGATRGRGMGLGAPDRWACDHAGDRRAQEVTLPELPSGTVTFLFTDLEGSTRLWERHPAAMGPALERHDALLRTAVEQHRGAVVKTTGDGLHAVFTTAQDALAAAVGAQRALAGETCEVPGGLRVRMGMHTGDAVVRQGDYYGAATNRAARVMDSAHG